MPLEAGGRLGRDQAGPRIRAELRGDVGGIAPGRRAFVNLVDDLREFNVTEVVSGPAVVARRGEYVGDLSAPTYPEDFRKSIKLRAPLTAGDFVVPVGDAARATDGTVDALVIGVEPYGVRTLAQRASMPIVDGAVPAAAGAGIAKIAVVERHFASGKVGLGFTRGFGIRRGAFGSSYHPGPVQIGIVGVDDADMAAVANRIAELNGGFVAVVGGRVVAEVALPLLGFLSEERSEDVVAAFRKVKQAIADELGADFEGLFTGLAYTCMPGVLPEVRMGVDGPVTVDRGEKELVVRPAPLLRQAGA